MTSGTLHSTMPRRATGSVESHDHSDGRTTSYYLRVRHQGRRHRITLGTSHEGWSDQRARVELERVMGQIERGTWTPPAKRTATVPVEDETVHVTLSRWWQRRQRDDLTAPTRDDYEWRIGHILRDPDLLHTVTADLDAQQVDEFRDRLRARGLGARSTNMVLGLLAMALDDAVEYGRLTANPARGKRRRVKQPKRRPTFLEPDMVVDLLDAAGEWERELPEHQRYGRRALLATLCLAGPRISEIVEAPLGRLDVHAGALVLGKKTAAGIDRHLELSAFLLDELRPHLASIPVELRERHGSSLPIFATRTGGTLNPSNVRNRLLGTRPRREGRAPVRGVVERVNERRAVEGRMLLPAITPHSLRRTWASLCFFAGRDLRWVMAQGGWEDPRMPLAVYAQAMARSRVDEALVWRLMRLPTEEETWSRPAPIYSVR